AGPGARPCPLGRASPGPPGRPPAAGPPGHRPGRARRGTPPARRPGRGAGPAAPPAGAPGHSPRPPGRRRRPRPGAARARPARPGFPPWSGPRAVAKVLAHRRLGNRKEARAWLTRAVRQIEGRSAGERPAWYQRAGWHYLRQEAEATLGWRVP